VKNDDVNISSRSSVMQATSLVLIRSTETISCRRTIISGRRLVCRIFKCYIHPAHVEYAVLNCD
jgi:hypothetical protein